MREDKIVKMVKDIEVNIFCYGKIVIPNVFYKLSKEEQAEVMRRIKKIGR